MDRFEQIAIAETTKYGSRYRVSTVKRIVEGSGRISYESMVFPGESWKEVYSDRYATRTESLKGHAALVAEWSD